MISDNADFYIDGLKQRNRRIISKTITLIESFLPAHRLLSDKILSEILPHTGNAIRLGITGVPGVGKSTFIESLGTLLTQKGLKIAVLAVDPSSSRSRGSVLADKTRMEKLCVNPDAFIRPSPSGCTLGGVARKTRETMLVCEAAGFDVIIVETVGVGQSETTVASMVDFFLVLMLAGAGDEIQGIKKGVVEIADAIAINKADEDNIEKANRAKIEYEKALKFLRQSSPVWKPPVLTCSSLKMTGIEEIWTAVLEHRKKLAETGEFKSLRQSQAVDWMYSLIEEGLKEKFFGRPQIAKILPAMTKDVKNQIITPSAAAEKLLTL